MLQGDQNSDTQTTAGLPKGVRTAPSVASLSCLDKQDHRRTDRWSQNFKSLWLAIDRTLTTSLPQLVLIFAYSLCSIALCRLGPQGTFECRAGSLLAASPYQCGTRTTERGSYCLCCAIQTYNEGSLTNL